MKKEGRSKEEKISVEGLRRRGEVKKKR